MKHLTSVALASTLLMGVMATSEAQAWERHRSTTGPYGGQATFHGSGSCTGGSCSSKQTWTGPGGRTATRSGSTSCSGGYCSGTATYTGRYGGTVTRSRSFRRY